MRHQRDCGTVYPGGVCCGQGHAGVFSTTVAGSSRVIIVGAVEQKEACCPEQITSADLSSVTTSGPFAPV